LLRFIFLKVYKTICSWQRANWSVIL